MKELGVQVAKALPGELRERPDRSDSHRMSFTVSEHNDWKTHVDELKLKLVDLGPAIAYAKSINSDVYVDTAIWSQDYEDVLQLGLLLDMAFLELLVSYQSEIKISIYSGEYVRDKISELEDKKN